MKQYKITISGARYPTDYNVSATNWPAAVARAVRLWRKRFKGEKTHELRIVAVKL